MQSAALYLLASFFAVTYGWQPMPDGSESYEYVVQLDQDLLTRLERGESIPISTDIPEEIQPIRRIRLVVGNKDLPRQKLVTSLKPEQAFQPDRNGAETEIVRGQYAEPAPRYSSNPNPSNPILPANSPTREILPRAREVENSVNALGDALQRSAREARNVAETQILPRSSQVLPRQSDAILPRNSTARVSENIRNTNASDEAALRELFADPQRNPRNVQVADQRSGSGSTYAPENSPTSAPILPRGSTPRSDGTGVSSNLGQPSDGTGSRYVVPAETTNIGSVSPPPRRVAPESTSSEIKARWPEEKRFESSPLAQEYNSGNGRYGSPRQTAPAQQQERAPASQNSFNLAREPEQSQNLQTPQLSFPKEQRFNNLTASPSTSPSTKPATPSGVPEIRRDMLNRPADEELRMASHSEAGEMPTSVSQPASVAKPVSAATGPPASSTVVQPEAETRLPASGELQAGTSPFPLILAWVLLFGSGGGNIYMLWSYLDIRSKYRGLVRSAGRKLGRRYLDDRYGEPDDYDE